VSADYERVQVLDKGFVGLVDYQATDLSVVNSARVSFGKRHEEMEEGDDKLVEFLLRENHGTPFEHNSMTFHVKCPIFVAREWVRHRIGSFNEISMRYTEIIPEFYIPEDKNVRTRVGKPGAYTYVPMELFTAKHFRKVLEAEGEQAARNYKSAMEQGIAPEQARMFLPVNTYTEFYWTINARSLMNFLTLRTAPTAQWEIQQYATCVEGLWSGIMPVSHGAWVKHQKKES
jgi:thymidylate synthase (FAD)